MKKTAFIFLLLCLAAAIPAGAQNDFGGNSGQTAGKTAIDTLLGSDLTAETTLLFDRITQDAGTLSEDQEPIGFKFRFRNAGTEAVTITKVSTTCGCTSAAVEVGGVVSESSVEDGGKLVAPVRVEAGAEGTVNMTFNPRNRPGTNDVRAFVYTDESEKLPVARLSLTGEVVEASPWSHYPLRMGPLRLMRNEVTLTLTGSAGKAVERILCVNAGAKALTLSADGLPPYARFRTEPETIEPGEEADLVISIDMEAATEWSRNLKGFSFLVNGAVARPGPDELIEVIIKNEN